MTDPWIVLQKHWIPKKWRAWYIGKYFTSITLGMGLKPCPTTLHGPVPGASWVSDELHAEVRRFTSDNKAAEGWHRDGDLVSGFNMDAIALVLWANRTPTLFKVGGKIYQPDPFDLVLVKNITHRRPDGCPEKRWVFRQRVLIPHDLLPSEMEVG